MTEFCPLCLSKGIKTQLKLFQINLSEATIMCADVKCPYPFVPSGTDIFVKRDFRTLPTIRNTGGDNSSVPSDNVNTDQGGDTAVNDSETLDDLLEMLKFDEQNSNNNFDLADILATFDSDDHSSRSDSGRMSADITGDVYSLEYDLANFTVDSVSKVNSNCELEPKVETDRRKEDDAEEATSASQSTTVQVHEDVALSISGRELTCRTDSAEKPFAETICGSDALNRDLANLMLEHSYFKDTGTRNGTEQELANVNEHDASHSSPDTGTTIRTEQELTNVNEHDASHSSPDTGTTIRTEQELTNVNEHDASHSSPDTGTTIRTIRTEQELTNVNEHDASHFSPDTGTTIRTEQELTNVNEHDASLLFHSSPAVTINCIENVEETQAVNFVDCGKLRKQTGPRKCQKRVNRKTVRKVKVEKEDDLNILNPDELHFDLSAVEESSITTANKSKEYFTTVPVKQDLSLNVRSQLVSVQKYDVICNAVAKCESQLPTSRNEVAASNSADVRNIKRNAVVKCEPQLPISRNEAIAASTSANVRNIKRNAVVKCEPQLPISRNETVGASTSSDVRNIKRNAVVKCEPQLPISRNETVGASTSTDVRNIKRNAVKCEPQLPISRNETVGASTSTDVRNIKPSIGLGLLDAKKFSGFSFEAAAEAAVLETGDKEVPRTRRRRCSGSRQTRISNTKSKTPSTYNVNVSTLVQVPAEKTVLNEMTFHDTEDWIKDLLL